MDRHGKYLSALGAWALAFGCSVGWGAFVMPGTTFLPIAGPVGTVIGVGIGGDFELAPLLAKKALLRPLGKPAEQPHIRAMEEELLEKAKSLGIGPAGLGGQNGVYAVHIETYATHIAELPVAVNICCHVNRHASREL